MRHVIVVVGSREQLLGAAPRINRGDSEYQRETTWYACADQDNPSSLLDDTPGFVLRFLRGLGLGYRFYQVVHGTKLWSGKRPLVIVRGRSFASRIAAYTGTWGGGDVVMPTVEGELPLGPARFVLDGNGNLKVRADQ